MLNKKNIYICLYVFLSHSMLWGAIEVVAMNPTGELLDCDRNGIVTFTSQSYQPICYVVDYKQGWIADPGSQNDGANICYSFDYDSITLQNAAGLLALARALTRDYDDPDPYDTSSEPRTLPLNSNVAKILERIILIYIKASNEQENPSLVKLCDQMNNKYLEQLLNYIDNKYEPRHEIIAFNGHARIRILIKAVSEILSDDTNRAKHSSELYKKFRDDMLKVLQDILHDSSQVSADNPQGIDQILQKIHMVQHNEQPLYDSLYSQYYHIGTKSSKQINDLLNPIKAKMLASQHNSNSTTQNPVRNIAKYIFTSFAAVVGIFILYKIIVYCLYMAFIAICVIGIGVCVYRYCGLSFFKFSKILPNKTTNK